MTMDVDMERRARVARMVADKVTDDMLTKPARDLTDAEVAIIRAVLTGPHADEIMARIDALRNK